MARQTSLALLREVDLLADLPLSEVGRIAEQLLYSRVKKGQVLIREGDPPLGLLFVESGLVKAAKRIANGREQIVGIHSRADVLGTLSSFDGAPHPVTLTAVTDAELHLLSQERFEALVAAHPELARRIIGILSERLRYAYEYLGPLAMRSVAQRLAVLLLRFSDQYEGWAAPNDEIRVQPLLSRTVFAQLAGTSRETLIRELHRLQRAGAIRIEGRQLIITDLRRLRRVAGVSAGPRSG